MIASVTYSQTLNNPTDADGYYIVKWDCDQGAFADSNDLEVDETFTFVIDVTGTPFEDWLLETPTAAGATRALAINKWTNYGDVSGGTNRLKQISPNIYGATWNIHQMATAPDLITNSVMTDSVVYIYGQVFGYEYTDDNPGAGWWMWPDGVPEATQIDPGTGSIFKTLPYTGTRTSPDFWSDEYVGGLFFSNNIPEQGYTLPCPELIVVNDIPEVTAETDADVIGHEYYSILGVRLQEKPQSGMYIHKMLKVDGTSVVRKEFVLEDQ